MANVKIGNRVFNGIEGIVLDNYTSGSTLYSLMDWKINSSNEPNYVKNRPFWVEEKSFGSGMFSTEHQFTFENTDTGYTYKCQLINDDMNIVPELFVNGQTTYSNNIASNNTEIIDAYCATSGQVDAFFRDSGKTSACILVQGHIIGFPSSWVICVLYHLEGHKVPIFGWIDPELLGEQHPRGLYAIETSFQQEEATVTIQLTNIKFNDIIINEDYGRFFHYLRNPIHVVPVTSLDATILTGLDLSLYNPGDFVFLTNGKLSMQ